MVERPTWLMLLFRRVIVRGSYDDNDNVEKVITTMMMDDDDADRLWHGIVAIPTESAARSLLLRLVALMSDSTAPPFCRFFIYIYIKVRHLSFIICCLSFVGGIFHCSCLPVIPVVIWGAFRHGGVKAGNNEVVY